MSFKTSVLHNARSMATSCQKSVHSLRAYDINKIWAKNYEALEQNTWSTQISRIKQKSEVFVTHLREQSVTGSTSASNWRCSVGGDELEKKTVEIFRTGIPNNKSFKEKQTYASIKKINTLNLHYSSGHI